VVIRYIRGAVREGWLTKQGGRIKTWKRRWVVLAAGGVLYYFDNKRAAAPKGVVPLEDIVVRSSVERSFAFSLSHSEAEGGRIKSAKALKSGSSSGSSGIVIDIGDAPDTRFEPPEGGYSPSWSIGCVLHQMITGRAPVTLLDVENQTETRALVRCLGAPTLSDSLALGIPTPARKARYDRISRRKVPGASFAENIILSETLTWDPARRMRCTSAGLVSATSIDMIEEGDD
jgi:hypothetical protein